ncbi:hypothetical protein N7U66_02295 [Lacinutrix neustonica]|uniref:Chloroplast import component protein (Tic20) n=1 Tax=Lacinutrix neustonica TaxID=2980107 RepID=A0A9E8SEA9_9FLAO|nr:hypothetical protein [Lacinutrix neustonica]WAC02552.1 hypothetical protein N7U66_02295 [Lacinutrix neustonica]
MNQQTVTEGKSLAILSYFTFIGTLIALFMNLEKKNPFTNFHIRQMIGLIIMLIFSNVVERYLHSWTGTILWIITFSFWLYALIYAIKGEMKLVPVLGEKFQVWFANLGN